VCGVGFFVGEVCVVGVKNSVLKFMVVVLLVVGCMMLYWVFDIVDVVIMVELLRCLGCMVEYDVLVGWV